MTPTPALKVLGRWGALALLLLGLPLLSGMLVTSTLEDRIASLRVAAALEERLVGAPSLTAPARRDASVSSADWARRLCAEGSASAASYAGSCSAFKWLSFVALASKVALATGALSMALLLLSGLMAFTSARASGLALMLGWGALRWVAPLMLLTHSALVLWWLRWWLAHGWGLWWLWQALVLLFLAFLTFIGMRFLRQRPSTSALPRDEAPLTDAVGAREVLDEVGALAKRLGAPAPRELMLEAETGQHAVLPGQVLADGRELQGPILVLDPHLVALLEHEELEALLVHELSHLAPGPAWQAPGLHREQALFERALASLKRDAPLHPVRLLPESLAALLLPALRRNRRRAELAADQAAAAVVSPQALAVALLKSTAWGAFLVTLWNAEAEEEERSGEAPPRPSELHAAYRRFTRAEGFVAKLRGDDLLASEKMDAPLAERLEALGGVELLARPPESLSRAPQTPAFKGRLGRGDRS